MIPTSPAAFTVSNLVINPSNVSLHKTVTISAVVTNTGDISGTYKVSLKINNLQVDAKDVTLAGKASQTVTFTPLINTVGGHLVNINGQAGSFAVNATAKMGPWIFIVMIIAVITGVGLAFLLTAISHRKNESNS